MNAQPDLRLTVRVVGHAVEYLPDRRNRFLFEGDGPVRLDALLERLGIQRALVMSAIVDGQRRELDYEPRDGSEVILITPPAGG